MYLLTPVQGSAKVIPGELNPLTISFFLLLLGPDFEIGGNFAVAVIHRGIGCLFVKVFFLRRRSAAASTLPSQATEWFLPALSRASTGVPSNRLTRITRFVYISHSFFSFLLKPETAAVLKRTVEALMERGAIVRNLENLGERSLPYKISKHKERHRRGGYAWCVFP